MGAYDDDVGGTLVPREFDFHIGEVVDHVLGAPIGHGHREPEWHHLALGGIPRGLERLGDIVGGGLQLCHAINGIATANALCQHLHILPQERAQVALGGRQRDPRPRVVRPWHTQRDTARHAAKEHKQDTTPTPQAPEDHGARLTSRRCWGEASNAGCAHRSRSVSRWRYGCLLGLHEYFLHPRGSCAMCWELKGARNAGTEPSEGEGVGEPGGTARQRVLLPNMQQGHTPAGVEARG
jgi:hypothetical protein